MLTCFRSWLRRRYFRRELARLRATCPCRVYAAVALTDRADNRGYAVLRVARGRRVRVVSRHETEAGAVFSAVMRAQS